MYCLQALTMMIVSSRTCSTRSRSSCNASLFSTSMKFCCLSDISPTSVGTIAFVPYMCRNGIFGLQIRECTNMHTRLHGALRSNCPWHCAVISLAPHNYLVSHFGMVVCLSVLYGNHSILDVETIHKLV